MNFVNMAWSPRCSFSTGAKEPSMCFIIDLLRSSSDIRNQETSATSFLTGTSGQVFCAAVEDLCRFVDPIGIRSLGSGN